VSAAIRLLKLVCAFLPEISPWLTVGEPSQSRKAKVQSLLEFAGKAVLCRKQTINHYGATRLSRKKNR